MELVILEKGQWSETKTAGYIELLNYKAKNGILFYKNCNKELKID